jgi:hypothetical protein
MEQFGFDRLIDIPESQLVRAIYDDRLLIGSVGIPPQMRWPVQFRLGVLPAQLRLAPSAFGDADGVLLESHNAHLARAVEYKRVKISANSYHTGQINKLQELAKAAHQANALHRAGFAFVWLTIIVVADTRPLTGGQGFAAPPGEMIARVRDAIPLSDLAPAVGVSVCQVAQVSDRPANERGGAGGQMLRGAMQQVQPPALTGAIADLFSRPITT